MERKVRTTRHQGNPITPLDSLKLLSYPTMSRSVSSLATFWPFSPLTSSFQGRSMLDLMEKAFNLGHTFAVNTAGWKDC